MMRTASDEVRYGQMGEAKAGFAAPLWAWAHSVLWNGFGNMGRVRAERRMELVETLQLGGKRQLMLVVCDGRRYLVGAGGDSVHSIAEMKSQPALSLVPDAISRDLPGFEPTVAMPRLEHELRCS